MTSRGGHREAIYLDDKDRELVVKLIWKYRRDVNSVFDLLQLADHLPQFVITDKPYSISSKHVLSPRMAAIRICRLYGLNDRIETNPLSLHTSRSLVLPLSWVCCAS